MSDEKRLRKKINELKKQGILSDESANDALERVNQRIKELEKEIDNTLYYQCDLLLNLKGV